LLAAALARPEAYAGLIVTSPRAVAAIERQRARHGPLPEAWREKPVYAVGPRTAAAVRALGWTPVGEEAGSGAVLARIIITAAEHDAEGAARPYLFLCGDRRRDDVPHRLTEAGLAVEECVVYRTHVRAGVKLPPASPGGWLVFFSPSGVEAVHPGEVRASGWRVAAIGPTTASALAEAGIRASAVAAEPTPEALLAALQAA
ncbi:MAG: uroporphyrinogen-III synthase, partial [Bacteroidetes bacterium]